MTAGPEEVLEVGVGAFVVTVPTGFGPRILGLRRRGGQELFAQLHDDITLDHPGGDVYRFRGGHRLWLSPEVPALTYAPDDHPCRVAVEEDRVVVEAPVDVAGLAKEITLRAEGEAIVVDHTITNRNDRPVTAAGWAITQLPPDGTAVLPISPGQDGPRASHSLVLWPYSNVSDGRLAWRRDAVLVEAGPGDALKLGTGPGPGRLGYLRHGRLFVKEFAPASDQEYPDLGAVAQVFVGMGFCELESVGPLTTLAPGRSLSHRERWRVEDCPDVGSATDLLSGGGR